MRELNALRSNIDRFLARNPYIVDCTLEADGWWVARTGIIEEPPPVLGVQVGCLAHEAVSALNHVTAALGARKLGARSAHKHRFDLDFPIFEHESRFRRAKVLPLVSKAAARAFEELQPFHRPPEAHGRVQHPLLLVKELADADKHRVLASWYGTVQLGPVLRGEVIHYDEEVASGPDFKQSLAPKTKRRMLRSGTELARVRFEGGNERANVRVAEPLAA